MRSNIFFAKRGYFEALRCILYTQIKKSVKVTEKTVIITENLLILGQQIVLLILAKHDCNFLVSGSSRFISKYTKN